MTQDKKFLGTEPVGRLLWKLAVPTVIAQLVNMLYNIVDRIYIGHIPGDGSLALTGVGVCLPIIMIISAFSAFVSSGGAPRASIAMGRGDYDQAQRILGGCFTLQVAISLVLTAVLLIWNRPLLLAFGASGNTIGYAVQYMQIYALGTLFVELTLGLNAFITAQGFARVGMKTVLIGAVCNILLDPLFIFALDMGVRGAALATVLSQAVSCVWVVTFLRGKQTLLRLEKAVIGGVLSLAADLLLQGRQVQGLALGDGADAEDGVHAPGGHCLVQGPGQLVPVNGAAVGGLDDVEAVALALLHAVRPVHRVKAQLPAEAFRPLGQLPGVQVPLDLRLGVPEPAADQVIAVDEEIAAVGRVPGGLGRLLGRHGHPQLRQVHRADDLVLQGQVDGFLAAGGVALPLPLVPDLLRRKAAYVHPQHPGIKI